MFRKRQYQYFVALSLPVLVTGFSLLLQEFIPSENIALIYIVAVIVTAVNTGMKPAMLSAFISFITFNFFFTQPLHTLLVLHPPDVLTVTLFVLTAVLVGHLAARLREQVEQLQDRERFSNIELLFMEKLAVAINPGHVLDALNNALQTMGNLEYALLPIKDGNLEYDAKVQKIPESLMQQVQEALKSHQISGESWVVRDDQSSARMLTDGTNNVAILITHHGNKVDGNRDSIHLLLHQANLALGRTRLVHDLEREKLGKEQEVLRSSLLSSVSHDFRTPLTSMIGATSTLLEMGNTLDTAQKEELLKSVLSEASRLDGYTQKLLDMTRLGYGELKLHRSTVSIEEILNVIMKRFKSEGKDSRLHMDIELHLPLLDVHAALIEQALYNVIENGLKFSPPGSPIEIRAYMRDDFMIIEVEDSGPGIPPAERQKVFEMFHSADRGDRRAAGTGLGLAICKGMVGAHGGSVTIRDAKSGSGCMMEIALPVKEEAEQEL